MTARYNYAYDDTNDAKDNDFHLKGNTALLLTRLVYTFSHCLITCLFDVFYSELGTAKTYGSGSGVEGREGGDGGGGGEGGVDGVEERQKWGSPVEFLLSCIAMSV